MLPARATIRPIQLAYTLTDDDLRDSIAAQQHRLWGRWLVPVLAVAALGAAIMGFISAEIWELSAGAAAIALAIALAVTAVIAGVAILLLRLLTAAIYRWQARLLVRGNPWLSQPVHATATDAGIHLRTSTGDATTAWSHYPYYIETNRSFVLLASKGIGAMSVVLPKRGLVEADPSQLRAVLATHAHERPR
ncbi:YcxB family protein [Micromonospora sp. NPDC002717]|uniref:YcxB family protein n=1 Tax=Micromonospora sp. NPDC002717 TaxID=3154424 RepID=UPI00332AB254